MVSAEKRKGKNEHSRQKVTFLPFLYCSVPNQCASGILRAVVCDQYRKTHPWDE